MDSFERDVGWRVALTAVKSDLVSGEDGTTVLEYCDTFDTIVLHASITIS